MNRDNSFKSKHVYDASDSMQGIRDSRENALQSDGDFAQVTQLATAPYKLLRKVSSGKKKVPIISPVNMLLGREFNYSGRGRFTLSDYSHLLSRYLPINGPSVIDNNNMMAGHVVSRFSCDGSLFVTAVQQNIRMYNVDSGWAIHKDVRTLFSSASVTDICISSDCSFLVYSSFWPIIGVLKIATVMNDDQGDEEESHEGVDMYAVDDSRISSVKISIDGRKIVASTGKGTLYFYDLEAIKLSHRICEAHEYGINSVCYADESGNIIYSGGKDCVCKVWDMRCFGRKSEAVGGMVGHSKGIACIDSRGDGRYFISNGKDHAIKLWDIRKMIPNNALYPQRIPLHQCMNLRPENGRPSCLKPLEDLSLATYNCHMVCNPFVRCNFSPVFSTGQKYIYTGSNSSFVYIYDVVSVDQIASLDCYEKGISDCSWHPFHPMLVGSCLDGTIVKWEFSSNGKKVDVSGANHKKGIKNQGNI